MITPELLKLSITVGTVLLIGATVTSSIAFRPESTDTAESSSTIELQSAAETTVLTSSTTMPSTTSTHSTSTTSTTTSTSAATTTTPVTTESLTVETAAELIKAEIIETEIIETESIGTKVIETEIIETRAIEPEVIETEHTRTEVIETEFDLASALETEQTEYTANAGSLIRGDMRGTYYAPGSWNGYSNKGGSGRYLLDCNYGGDGYAKGSIASGYLYELLGYYANDGRTAVWLEVSGYPDMSGVYYLDDCSGADVIDFFYDKNANCQFSYAGVVSVDVYYLN